jgi:tRNA threonylcarbamoyladenosine biosynthesis protein TsaB
MKLLALETSTLVASVALIDGDRAAVRERGAAEGTHSSDLLALLDAVMAEAGVVLDAVDAVAVGAGPGSFTGLRIGMATAKGLAFAARKPLLAASSLAALALDAAPLAPPGALIVPLIDARRGELFAGFYRADDVAVTAVGDDRVVAPADLAAAIAAVGPGVSPVALCGDGASLVADLGVGQPLAARLTPSARSIAALAAAGRASDGLHAGPTYLRPAEAELKFPPGAPPPGGVFTAKK